MSASDRKWNQTKLYAALLGTALVLGACSPTESDDGPILGFDGSTGMVLVPDATVTLTNDAGSALPVRDAGTSPLPSNDSGSQSGLDSGLAPGSDATVTPTSDGSVLDTGALDTGVGDGGDAGDSSVVADSGMADSGDGAVPDAQVPPVDQGKGNGSDVVTIGDSWMDNTLGGTGGGIASALRSASSQPYRNYAKQGTKLLGIGLLFDPPIPDQWDQALRANRNIKTVVMTGGGNDVILDDAMKKSCQEGGPECAMVLAKIRDALKQMWAKMATGGVTNIVHVMYAKVAGDGLKDAEANAAAIKAVCDAVPAPTRCHLFFTDTYVKSKSDLTDGIHPKAAINTSLARGLFEFMTKEGMRR
jgi:lysophospholipase L1-like esterase